MILARFQLPIPLAFYSGPGLLFMLDSLLYFQVTLNMSYTIHLWTHPGCSDHVCILFPWFLLKTFGQEDKIPFLPSSCLSEFEHAVFKIHEIIHFPIMLPLQI